MKCGKCGALISDGSLVCSGCNTPVAELRMKNLLLDNNVVSVADAASVPEVQDLPIVEPTPTVDIVEVQDLPVLEPTSVVEVEAVSVVEPTPVVEVEAAPVVEPTPVVEVETAPVVEPTPIVEVETAPVIEESPINGENDILPETIINPISDNSLQMNVPNVEETIINNVVEDVAPTVASIETQDVSEKKKKNTGKFVLIGCLVFVICFLLLGTLGYFLVYSKPSYTFKTTLKEFKNKLVFNEEEISAYKYKISLQTKLKSSDSAMQELFDNINKIYLELDGYADVKTEVIDVKLDLKYDNKNMFDIDGYVENYIAYIKLNGVHDKYISLDMTSTASDDVIDEIKSFDYDAIVDGFSKALSESLKDEYFAQVKKSININNLVVETKANTLVIDKNNIGEFTKNMVNSLKNNDKFLTEYSKMADMEKAEIIEELDDLVTMTSDLSTLTEDEKNAINYQFTIYTTGLLNDVVGYGVSIDGESANFYFDETYYVLNLTIEGTEEKIFEAKVISENKYDVTIYVDENPYLFELGFEYAENPSYTKPNISNSIKYEELSDDDAMLISAGLLSSEGLELFMTDFEPVIEMLSLLFGDSLGGDVETTPDTDNYYDDVTSDVFEDFEDFEDFE